MLVIRQEQINAMIAADEKQLEALVADAVRSANAERIKDYEPDALNSMVRTAIARARSHGLAKPEDLAAFAGVMFEIAPNFDEQPDIKLILSDQSFPPAERLYQLFERVGDTSWAEAEKRYDELVWFRTRPQE